MLIKLRDKNKMLKMVDALLGDLQKGDYMKLSKEIRVDNAGKIVDFSFILVMPDYSEEPTKH